MMLGRVLPLAVAKEIRALLPTWIGLVAMCAGATVSDGGWQTLGVAGFTVRVPVALRSVVGGSRLLKRDRIARADSVSTGWSRPALCHQVLRSRADAGRSHGGRVGDCIARSAIPVGGRRQKNCRPGGALWAVRRAVADHAVPQPARRRGLHDHGAGMAVAKHRCVRRGSTEVRDLLVGDGRVRRDGRSAWAGGRSCGWRRSRAAARTCGWPTAAAGALRPRAGAIRSGCS